MKKNILTKNDNSSAHNPSVLPTGLNNTQIAPGSFFARVQRLFAGSSHTTEQDQGTELFLEVDEFFEYHNPTLSISGFGKES